MSDIVISVENLGKSYRINHAGGERERYTALRDVIARQASAPLRWAKTKFQKQKAESRKQERTGLQKQKAESGRQDGDIQKQKAGSRKQHEVVQEQEAESGRQDGNGNDKSGSDFSSQRSASGFSDAADSESEHSNFSSPLSASSFSSDSETQPFDFSSQLSPFCSSEDFWALRNVSFEVKQGEVLGIIGRNGAGKSTLLKILSRITEPTCGKVRIKGRVASLLEIGTGFHPELTGRENIYLNGAILGMSRSEIRAKFDEIVAFAEVEKFLDTPIKRYSSGMYVRLAFAVAAHLDPEILIVDEVLAVGDTEFQKKCLGKMENIAGAGRTVFFVSHNMVTIRRLCTRCGYLKEGRIVMEGPTDDAIDRYLAETGAARTGPLIYGRRNECIEIDAVELLVRGEPCRSVATGATLTFRVRYRCCAPDHFPEGLECGFIVYGHGQKLANFWSNAGLGRTFRVAASGAITCCVPAWPFRSMRMTLQLHINYRLENLVDLPEALTFDSADSDRFGTGILPHASEGLVLLPHTWAAETDRT